MPYWLKNPHSVLAALEVRPKDVLEVIVSDSSSIIWKKIGKLAQEKKIPVRKSSFNQTSKKSFQSKHENEESFRASSSTAFVVEKSSLSLEDLFRNASQKQNGRGLWLALDCLQDPQNVGSIFRSAAFFGIQGILMTSERSVSLTPTIYGIRGGGSLFHSKPTYKKLLNKQDNLVYGF